MHTQILHDPTDDTEAATLGVFIQSLRKKRGLSYRALASHAAISHATLRNWETSKFLPRLPELQQVLVALTASRAEQKQAIALLDRPRALAHIHAGLEKDSAIGPMVGLGELLRAMRRRRGHTLEAVALRLGVAARTVSRWERGERVPPLEQIHGYCHAVGATTEEMVLLTLGNGQDADAENSRSPGASLERLRAIFAEQWAYPQPQRKVALTELTLLSLVSQLQEMARQNSAPLPLVLPFLVEVYASLANHYYAVLDQPRQVLLFGERAMTLAASLALPQLSIFGVVGVARFAEVSHPNRALKTLRYWLKAAPDPGCESWLISLMADAAHRLQRPEETERYSYQSIQVAERAPTSEWEGRRMARAKLLISQNRVQEALPLMLLLSANEMPPDLSLVWSQALLALKRESEASQMLEQCYRRLDLFADTWENMAPLIRRQAEPIRQALAGSAERASGR